METIDFRKKLQMITVQLNFCQQSTEILPHSIEEGLN